MTEGRREKWREFYNYQQEGPIPVMQKGPCAHREQERAVGSKPLRQEHDPQSRARSHSEPRPGSDLLWDLTQWHNFFGPQFPHM